MSAISFWGSMERDERISEVIDGILKSDDFDELLANEDVSLSISQFIQKLIQQDIQFFVADLLGPIVDEKSNQAWKEKRETHKDLFGLLEIDLEHVKTHLKDAVMEKAIAQVEDEILHPSRGD